ncbi:hypothetical protein fugu_009527 [Takifugu bimaculatus]|uniref:G-protein coupled receptors family 1 profile domain-containing protein n=1 Tax=Takifugu bimaculatus TaxID=433685 RepID=A0A4Z2CD28_9TELE|nr:hypothetical protein fugu_009527 [Takifugu bimaculatus]
METGAIPPDDYVKVPKSTVAPITLKWNYEDSSQSWTCWNLVCQKICHRWPLPPVTVAPPTLRSTWTPPLSTWETPSFTSAAQFRVGATLVLFVFAACSNLALLASVGRGRRPPSHLRPLMLSLVSADLMMTFVVMPLDAVWNVTVQWHGGDALCKVLCFLKLFAMYASAFILVVISLDRHHVILHPLNSIKAHKRNRQMLLVAWTLSILLATPQLFIFRAVRMEAADFTQCATHGSFSRRWQETVYNMFHFITLYVVPLLVMSCCYSRILLHIHLQHLREKGIWYWFQPDMLRVTPEYVHHVLFVFGNLNTCCDPVIYGFYTPSFRADLAACFHQKRRNAARAPPNRARSRDVVN